MADTTAEVPQLICSVELEVLVLLCGLFVEQRITPASVSENPACDKQ